MTIPFLAEIYTVGDVGVAIESYHPGTGVNTARTNNLSGGNSGGALGNSGTSLWHLHGDGTVVTEYTIVSDSWSSSTSATASRQSNSNGSSNGALIVGYGEDGSNVAQDDFYTFNYSGETWATETADTGNNNTVPGHFCWGRQLHTCGGSLSPNTVHKSYDLYADTHVSRTSIPRNTQETEGSSIATRGHVIGGWDGSATAYANNYVLNLEDDSWALTASHAAPGRRLIAGGSDLANIYKRGGIENPISPPTPLNLNDIYNIATDSWSTGTDLITGGYSNLGEPKNGSEGGTVILWSVNQIEYIDSGANPENTGRIKITFSIGHDYESPPI